MNQRTEKDVVALKSEQRRQAMGKLGKYAVGGSAALFSLSARSQSVTNCGTNHQDNPPGDGSGGNNCNGKDKAL